MLSISQFTEKFLEQNLSKFLYHVEVIVRCVRGSVLSFLFTHFIVLTSCPPCSSPLTLFLSSSHVEVIVRCVRGSVLSFLFTHFIVLTSCPPCSSPLTLFLSSSLPSSLVIPTSFRLFLTPWFTSFLLFPFFLFALVFPSSSSFFLLSLLPSFLSPPTHFFFPHSLLPFLTFSLGSSPLYHPPPPPSWSCISAYSKSRFVYPRYFENV